jgi:hypothetical protein
VALRLRFELPCPVARETVRGGFEALASRLIGRPVSLDLERDTPLEDPNGAGLCREAAWRDGDVAWTERVVGGSGNPRDGYGYDVRFELRVPRGAGTAVACMVGSSYAPYDVAFDVSIEGAAASEFGGLRTALAAFFGAATDRNGAAWVARDTVVQLWNAGERDTAVALAEEALAGSRAGDWGREELAAWLAKAVPRPDGLGARLRDAPALLDGWLEAEAAPPPGWTRERVTEVLARLCPFDPGRWPGGAPWFAHPCWPAEPGTSDPSAPWWRVHIAPNHIPGSLPEALAQAITGFKWGVDWQPVAGEGGGSRVGGWSWRVTRWARYGGGRADPTARVELQATLKGPVAESVRWTWIHGEGPGDALLVVLRERAVTRSRGPRPHGVAWCTVGTPAFQRRCADAVAATSPYRWYDDGVAVSLEPFAGPPAPALAKDGAPTRELAGAALAAAPLDESERARARELLPCDCSQPAIGFCPHRVELLNRSRAWRQRALDAGPPRAGAEARGCEAALEAAFDACGDEPDRGAVLRAVERLEGELRILGELA